MTQYELWMMDSKKLVQGYKAACIAQANGKESAIKAAEIIEAEILRRLKLAEVE